MGYYHLIWNWCVICSLTNSPMSVYVKISNFEEMDGFANIILSLFSEGLKISHSEFRRGVWTCEYGRIPERLGLAILLPNLDEDKSSIYYKNIFDFWIMILHTNSSPGIRCASQRVSYYCKRLKSGLTLWLIHPVPPNRGTFSRI